MGEWKREWIVLTLLTIFDPLGEAASMASVALRLGCADDEVGIFLQWAAQHPFASEPCTYGIQLKWIDVFLIDPFFLDF